MSTQPKHLWMATVKIVFSVPANAELNSAGSYGTIETNVMIDTLSKKMTSKNLSTLQQISLMKLMEQQKIDPEWVSDFIIMNLSYLGLMSINEYLGKD